MKHVYDEELYIKGMKKFQKESRGLMQGTTEYENVRNKVYNELRKVRHQEQSEIYKSKERLKDYHESMMVADFSSFYILLIVVPEETESYETMNVLKYFNFPFNIEEDNILKKVVKKEMGFKAEDAVMFWNILSPIVPMHDD